MATLTLGNLGTYLMREGDYTVRLRNRNLLNPCQYIFAILWFDGNQGLWTTQLVSQNMKTTRGASGRQFSEAKQQLISDVKDYVNEGYLITSVKSIAYSILPWLRRKSRQS